MPERSFSTLVDLVEGMRDAPSDRGIRLVSADFREARVSYPELYRRVSAHAEHLRRQGVESGQKVVVPLTTDLDVIGSFLALAWIGAVPVSVSGRTVGQDRRAYARHVLALRERFDFDRILMDRALEEGIEEGSSAERRLTACPPEPDPGRPPRVAAASPAEDDLAFLQYSSGSTGEPKGVRVTHRNLCSNLRLVVEADGREPEETGVSWLPLSHDMGLVGGFLSALVQYNDLVLMSPVCFLMRPVSWLDSMSRHRCAVSGGPNFAIELCNTRIRDAQLEARSLDLSALRYVYNGSEPVDPDVIERFYERFAPYGLRRGILHPVYGMAETTVILTAPPRGSGLIVREIAGGRFVSVGRPLGDFELRIVGEDGAELPRERVGEIVVRGTSVTPGYYRDDAENRRRFRGGWFHTGDLGLLDLEGQLFVTGRIKDLIIVNGRNYYGHDIAAKIEELPFVRRGRSHAFAYPIGGREAAVVMMLEAAPAASGKERLRGDVEALKDAVKTHVLRELGLAVHDVFVVPRIPRTTSGKVRRSECESLYREYLESGARIGGAPEPGVRVREKGQDP